MDRWLSDQIYITGGQAYGLSDDLRSIYLGTEAELMANAIGNANGSIYDAVASQSTSTNRKSGKKRRHGN